MVPEYKNVGVSLSEQLNILQIILESGYIVKGVLLSLILASIVSWGIIFLKKKTIKTITKNNDNFWELYSTAETLRDVRERCDSLPDSPYRSMFLYGYEELIKFKETSKKEDMTALKKHFEKYGMGAFERALRKGENASLLEMEKSLATLASIGSISPFIGLFGTVWGIIDSFTGIAGGGATLDAVAPGIAEALVATAVGLAAAIPAVWFYNHFNNENGKIQNHMESFEKDFINVVERTLV